MCLAAHGFMSAACEGCAYVVGMDRGRRICWWGWPCGFSCVILTYSHREIATVVLCCRGEVKCTRAALHSSSFFSRIETLPILSRKVYTCRLFAILIISDFVVGAASSSDIPHETIKIRTRHPLSVSTAGRTFISRVPHALRIPLVSHGHIMNRFSVGLQSYSSPSHDSAVQVSRHHPLTARKWTMTPMKTSAMVNAMVPLPLAPPYMPMWPPTQRCACFGSRTSLLLYLDRIKKKGGGLVVKREVIP